MTPGTADDKDILDAYGDYIHHPRTVPAAQTTIEDLPTVLPRQIMTGTFRGVQTVGSGPDKIDGANSRITVSESHLLFTDIVTNNVSTTKHGYVPKAPNSTTQFLRGDGAWAVPPYPAAPTQQLILLKANSGTDTTATATNVDTYALTGLTAKDTLAIYWSVSSLTQLTTVPTIRSTTDTADLIFFNKSTDLAAGQTNTGSAFLRQEQQSNTTYGANWSDGTVTTASGASTVGQVSLRSNSVTTAWTGSWTIALRHGGVTAGGTFRWSWVLYKMAGQ